jgi:hypothetical protein
MSDDAALIEAHTVSGRRPSKGRRYIRVYLVAVGLIATVAGISVATPGLQYNRISYAYTLLVLFIVWSPVLLISRRRAFAVAAFGVAAVIVLMEIGTTLGAQFPICWLVTAPMLVASLLSPPPSDTWTWGFLGGTALGCVVFATVFATTVPVGDTIVKLCIAEQADTRELDDALDLDELWDIGWISLVSYGPTAVVIQVKPYTSDANIDQLVSRAESSPLFGGVDVGGSTSCRDAPRPTE